MQISGNNVMERSALEDHDTVGRSLPPLPPPPGNATDGRSGAPPPPAPADRPTTRLAQAARSILKSALTLLALAVAAIACLVIWDYYVTAPWTRDGRVRVQVAGIAPEVSGRIVELRTVDNQFVHKGDVLYVIDPFDYQVAVDMAKAEVDNRAADLQVKQAQ